MDDLPPVLVAEDVSLIRALIVETLQDGGYLVVEAACGAAALELLNDIEQLRGIVTDIRMGEGPDGWEVARLARERFPNVPVVYVTGDSAADWTAKGVPTSVLLQKPFASSELVVALANQATVPFVDPHY